MEQEEPKIFKVNEDSREVSRAHKQSCIYGPKEGEDKVHGRWHEHQSLEQLIPLLQAIRQRTTTPIRACGTCNPVLPQEVKDLFRG